MFIFFARSAFKNDPEALELALREGYTEIAKLCLRWGAKKWPIEYNNLVLELQKEVLEEK